MEGRGRLRRSLSWLRRYLASLLRDIEKDTEAAWQNRYGPRT